MLNIIVLKRTSDYIAYIEGEEKTWECGVNDFEAIGKLIITIYSRGNSNISIRRGLSLNKGE